MTLNYIDHLQKGKERINKRNNNNIDAFISDDGFPLGVAYLLKILNQTEQFNSLNWFKSMEHKYEKDKKSTMQRINAPMAKTKTGVATSSYNEDNFEQELSIKRIENNQNEFKLLDYCFSASQILFKEI